MSLEIDFSALSLDNKKMIKLQSKDLLVESVPLEAAMKSEVIARLINDLSFDTETDAIIPLPTIASEEMKKTIGFLVYHKDDNKTGTELRALLLKNELSDFDSNFIDVDRKILIELYKAANYLDIDLLKELTAWAIAKTIKGKTPAQINEFWNFDNDFSVEERRKVNNEHAWTEQKA